MQSDDKNTIETGWLIEVRGSGRPQWWTGNLLSKAQPEWTRDSLKAIRFARQQDANTIIAAIGWTQAFARERPPG